MNIKNFIVNTLKEHLNKYFTFERSSYHSNEDVLVLKGGKHQLWIDEWFKTNKHISKDLKNDNTLYGQQYDNVYL